MFFKIPFILIVLFSKILTQSSDDPDPSVESTNPLKAFRNQLKSKIPICSPGLGNAYGLNGYINPITLPSPGFMFCPDISSTCCSADDAASAFATLQGGLKALKQQFSVYRTIVSDFIDQLIIARNIAYRVNNRLAKVKFANCKVLASKTILYDIDTVGPQVLQSIDEMYKTMLFSYKGFYCEICDAAKNKFIFNDDSFVVIHKDQCRQIVQGAVKPLYYLKLLFVNFANIVSKFLTNCDAKGTFFDDVLVPQFILTGTQEDKIVERCWNERNSPKWLEDCKEFCDKWNMVTLSDFFKPFARKLIILTDFYKKRTLQMVSQETLDSSIDIPATSGSIGLMEDLGYNQNPPLKFLDAYSDEDYQNADSKAQVVLASIANGFIISSIAGSGNPIDTNTIVYMERGFNFYYSGKSALVQTSDDASEPGTTMSSKKDFTVNRLDSKEDKTIPVTSGTNGASDANSTNSSSAASDTNSANGASGAPSPIGSQSKIQNRKKERKLSKFVDSLQLFTGLMVLYLLN